MNILRMMKYKGKTELYSMNMQLIAKCLDIKELEKFKPIILKREIKNITFNNK